MTKPLMVFLVIASLLSVNFKFNTHKKSSHSFCYRGATYSKANVEDVSQWVVGPACNCDEVNSKACQIIVDYVYTHLNGSGDRVLNDINSSIYITVGSSLDPGNNTYYVDTDSYINIITVVNKS